jgi:hypothetical protein
MWNDYLELPQVKFLIEHWMFLCSSIILFGIILYFGNCVDKWLNS